MHLLSPPMGTQGPHPPHAISLPAGDEHTRTDIVPFLILLRNPVVTKQDYSAPSHGASENRRAVRLCGSLATLHRDMGSPAPRENGRLIQSIPLWWSQLCTIMWPLTFFTMDQDPLVTFACAFQSSSHQVTCKSQERNNWPYRHGQTAFYL